MIRQGSNEPYVFKVPNKTTLPNCTAISVEMFSSGGRVLEWDKDAVEIASTNDKVLAPLTEEETSSLDVGPIRVVCRILGSSGNILFLQDRWDYVVKGGHDSLGGDST